METDLKFRPFRSPADPGWNEAWAIYQNSFPQKEIRSLEDHLQALSDPHYTADGIWSPVECHVETVEERQVSTEVTDSCRLPFQVLITDSCLCNP